jgi:squalene-hopene/tetraprenyl-beta-curcumene cyclase
LRELEDGGWSIYPGGPAELNTTIKCYLALKLKGFDERSSMMMRDRQIIISLGGSRDLTAIQGCIWPCSAWAAGMPVPPYTPEIVLLPDWSPVNIYDFSAWTRTIVVPLSIIWAHKPVRPIEKGFNVDELYKDGRRMRNCGIKPDSVSAGRIFFSLPTCA